MKSRLAILLFTGKLLLAQPGWWSTEPIRWVQTNLREVDAAMDTRRLVSQLAEMRANVVLMGMGGISAYYPTPVEFPLPAGGPPHVRRRPQGGSRPRHPGGRPLRQNPSLVSTRAHA